MSTAESIYERQKNVVFPAATPYYGDKPLVIDRAKDQYVWDVDGNQYLDFFGGVLTVSVGHSNDEVTGRIIEQIQRGQHFSTLYVNELMVQLAEKVAEIAPGRLQKSYFTNSGTEANETAIMAARMYTGNSEIITLRHAYSGRSQLAMSLTAHGTWRLGGVFDGSIKHMRNPYTYRAPLGLSEDEVVELCVQDLEEILATVTSGKIAAFMAEPIQGVGGFITPPKNFFKRLLPIVHAAGGVFIADEVQTGWGRTGSKWFGIEHYDVEPDIITTAKGMANGTPIGATITTPEIADAVKGLTFSTFGGNPVTMTAALATIEFIEKNNLLENAEQQGVVLREKLEELQSEFNFVGEVRGMGLMQGVEIVKPGPGKEPDAARTGALMSAARDRGLLIGKGGLYGNVLRVAPHLNVTSEDLLRGAEIIAQSTSDVA
jgi:4-aminobutyrate aminotransferase-like enzyme